MIVYLITNIKKKQCIFYLIETQTKLLFYGYLTCLKHNTQPSILSLFTNLSIWLKHFEECGPLTRDATMFVWRTFYFQIKIMYKQSSDVDRYWSNEESLHTVNDLCFRNFVLCTVFRSLSLFSVLSLSCVLWHRKEETQWSKIVNLMWKW